MENKLIHEIQEFEEEFFHLTQKIVRQMKRQEKIMARSDKIKKKRV